MSNPPFLTGTAGSGEALYFTDQYNNPYMVQWETVWALIVNAGNSGGGTTYQSDMAGYCAARSAQGFNGILVTPTNTTEGGAPSDNGNTWDGVAPFSSPGVLNNTFWIRLDYLLAQALSYGMTVCVNAMMSYSLYHTVGAIYGWTNTQYQNYGAAVGARYASQANLVWEVGDDYGDAIFGGQTYDTQFSSFLTGLRGAGANQLISIENQSDSSSRYSDDGSTSYTWGIANAQFNWCYSYNTSYNAVEDSYTEAAAHSVTSLCNVKMDGQYDNQWGGVTPTESIELYWRKWAWWALSSGSRGFMYGNGDLFSWPSGAIAGTLLTANPGASYVKPAALATAWSSFGQMDGWHLLVPDTGSALVTAGRGTRSGELSAGGGTFGAYPGGNTYVTASITPAGTLAVIYIPAAANAITVNAAAMASGYGAAWVDPASGARYNTTIASTYSHSAANSAGDPDWLLVLSLPAYTTWTVP